MSVAAAAEQQERLWPRLANLQRLVQLSIVLGLLWKVQFFVWCDEIYFQYLLVDPFFPDWLESQWTLRIAYIAAVTCGLIAIIAGASRFLTCVVLAELLCLSVLLLHQGSYNDMTFLTSWWASLWCFWLTCQRSREDHELTSQRAARLGCVMLSLIMLGASVGKWTGEYWSGIVLHEIYFRERDFWLFNVLRDQFTVDQRLSLAMWHSRVVIVIETVAGFTLWCLPSRLGGCMGLALMLMIPLTNNFLLFSVTLSLIGLSLAIALLPNVRAGSQRTDLRGE